MHLSQLRRPGPVRFTFPINRQDLSELQEGIKVSGVMARHSSRDSNYRPLQKAILCGRTRDKNVLHGLNVRNDVASSLFNHISSPLDVITLQMVGPNAIDARNKSKL